MLVLGLQEAPKLRSFLGAQVSESASVLKIDRVVAGSPAEKAGLKVGDLINTMDGAPVTTQAAFVKAIQERGVGATIELFISRDEGGETSASKVRVKLEAHPQDLLVQPDTSPGVSTVIERVRSPCVTAVATSAMARTRVVR
ncbi:MAG TPA: PDZ domain-containing protein, partial [Planctomycetota bacterium]|nr:PDZ domain-containing protein [Planctomycetota bacterium]